MRTSFWPKFLGLAVLAGFGTYYCHAQREAQTAAASATAKSAESAAFRKSLTIDDSAVKRSEPLMKSYADILDKVEPAVVKISTYQTVDQGSRLFYDMYRNQYFREKQKLKDTATGLGSGVIVNKAGYVITNNHVIEKATKIKVLVPGHDKEYDAEVISRDPNQDVAVIKIDGENFVAATLADSSQVRRGDIVFAVGAPFGFEQSASMGIISSVGQRSVGMVGDGHDTVIQTDAAVNPGNSGGPLVDAEGRVIGINTFIYSNTGSTAGIGFAIPVNRVVQVASVLVTGEAVGQSGYLGITTEDVDPEIAKILEMPSPDGALVNEVQPDSPAAKSGIQRDDVLVDLQGRKLQSHTQLGEEIRNFPAGREITLGVWRNKQRLEVKVTLGDLAATMEDKNGKSGSSTEESDPSEAYGLQLTALTDDWRQRLGLSELAEGVIVDSVLPNSSAAALQLEKGDLLTRINLMDVSTPRQAQEAFLKNKAQGKAMIRVHRGGRTATRMLEASK